MSRELIAARDYLIQALPEVKQLLSQFIADADFSNEINLAFSLSPSQSQSDRAREIINQWLATESILPQIETVTGSSINGALGAYAAETDTIYLSQEFLLQNQDNPDAIRNVLLEELGHAVSDRLNPEDAPGDEGEIFSLLVQGEDIAPQVLAELQREDDTVTVTLNNQDTEIEQAQAGENLAFDLIGLTDLRNDPIFAGIDGTGFDVVVIDTGLDQTHPLLDDNYEFGIDYIDGDTDPNDLNSHGTHVSGIIGAEDENIGVAPDVGLIGLKVGDAEGLNGEAIIRALTWVRDEVRDPNSDYNIVAVNLSLGNRDFFYISPNQPNSQYDNELRRLIEELEAEGVVVIAAAGNDYVGKRDEQGNLTDSTGNLLFPNQEPNLSAPAIYSTLAVGAVWQDNIDPNGRYRGQQIPGADRIAIFSQRLDIDNFLFAPGAFINSTVPEKDGVFFDSFPGTSQAAPHVTGAVALLQEIAAEYGTTLTPEQIRDYLIDNADIIFDGDDEEDIVKNTGVSYPRINIHRAAIALREDLEGIDNTPEQNNTGDVNGTIAAPLQGPVLSGSSESSRSATFEGNIGFDGSENSVGNRDVDLYRFRVETPGNVSFTLEEFEDNGFVGNLRLFDAAGNEIALSGSHSVFSANLDADEYYLGVSGRGNSNYDPQVAGSGSPATTTGNYSLSFNLNNNDPNGIVSGAIDVNLGNAREPLIFSGVLGQDYGEAVTSADVDLYRITTPDNGTLQIDIDTPYADNFPNSFLRLFGENEAGEIVPLVFSSSGEPAENDDNPAPGEVEKQVSGTGETVLVNDENTTTLVDGNTDEENNYQPGNYGHTTDSYLSFRAERGVTYYIGVSDFTNSEYSPVSLNDRPTSAEGGQYELIATFINDDVDGSITQITDDTALPTTNLRGFIGTDRDSDIGNKDVDFYRINSPTTGILEIDIDSETEASISNSVDSVVVLFDADGNRLGLNDDTDTRDARLRYQIEADTDYYVAVTGFGNQDFDPFALGSGSGGDTGEYIFNSRLLSLDAASSISNNTIDSNIRDLTVNETISGRIGEDAGYIIGATDVDIYRFVAAENGVIEIRAGANQEYSADTVLRLFDAAGNEIGFNDDENSQTRGSFLRAEVEAGTEYYIGINGYSENARNYNPLTGLGAAPGSQGDYTLFITTTASQDSIDLPNTSEDLIAEADFLDDPQKYISAIRDFDGVDLGSSESWKNIGSVDIQGDGDVEHIFVNPALGRWASVGANSQGNIDFSNYGQGGDTRVVGIYIDPLIATGEVEAGSDFDSQQRFQNDLSGDNLELLAADDYDGDGLQETYFRLGDGSAVLHAYMHADGNIQYANYQSESDLEQFMTDNGIDESVWGEWL